MYLRAFFNQPIVLGVLKGRGEDSKIAEIGLMDAGEAFGNLGPNPKISGPQGGMFPAGSLPVIFTADDGDRSFFPAFLGEIRIDLREDKFAEGFDVGTQGQDFVAGRHDGIGGDIVPDFDHHFGFKRFRQGSIREGA